MIAPGDQANGVHVVLGARGAIGAAIVRELVGRGRRVRAVTRDGRAAAGPGVLPPALYEDVAADVTDRELLRGALAGARVVYQCARPRHDRRARTLATITRLTADVAAEAGAKLVVVDDFSPYGIPAGVLSERTEALAVSAAGRSRAALQADLLAAYRSGRLLVTIGRSSDHFGPGVMTAPLGDGFFADLLAGAPVRWPCALDRPHTVHYVPDVARAYVLMAESDAGDGHVWHVPAAPPVTGREFVALAAAAAGVPARPVPLGRAAARLRGWRDPARAELCDAWYRWERPLVSEARRFTAAFPGVAPTSLEEALTSTIAWRRKRR